jgi:fatty acid desaturase
VKTTRVEWPTLVVAVGIAAGFAAVLLGHESLPTPVVVGALALLGAWYNSLQHEVIHGHPTPWRGVNTALAAAPLGLVVPFAVYREIHLAHHRADPLTDPDLDPESFYVSAATWNGCGPVRRARLRAMQTLAGRMVLGPPLAALRWWRRTLSARGPAAVARITAHVGAVALILVGVQAAGLAVWVYVVGVAWGGGALSLLRSFAEHRRADVGTPSAVVRTGWFFSLLFLNNNLHHTHHARPGVPWYGLPEVHARLDGDRVAAAGAGLYRGYGEISRRYLFRPFDDVVARPADEATAVSSASG